jgi:hypothetical protein
MDEAMSDETLRKLESAVRGRPVERALCCPECDGRDFTGVGPYACVICLSEYDSLKELKPIGQERQ